MKYRETKTELTNPALRWDVPPENQGQTIEVAYAHVGRRPDLACPGARYKRVTDTSLPPGHPDRVRYFIRAPDHAAAWERFKRKSGVDTTE